MSFASVPVAIPDGQAIGFGEQAARPRTGYDTADGNARMLKTDFPSGGSFDVPWWLMGVGIAGVDLGVGNGSTEPLWGVVDADRDSYAGVGFSADDVAVLDVRLGAAGTRRQHVIPDVASSTLAVLGAAQEWTANQSFKAQLRFWDTLGDASYETILRGTQNQSAGGPAALEITAIDDNKPVWLWFTPTGTPTANTDSGIGIIIQGTPFVSADATYAAFGINHGATIATSYLGLGTYEEGNGTLIDVRFFAGSLAMMRLAANDTGVLNEPGTEMQRNLEFIDLNDDEDPPAGYGKFHMTRARRGTASNRGYSWEQLWQAYPFTTDAASGSPTPTQISRYVKVRAIGNIGDWGPSGTGPDAPYYLQFRDNGNAEFLGLAGRIGADLATVDISPQAQNVGNVDFVGALRARSATYTITGARTEVSNVNIAALVLSGAFTTDDAASVVIQGAPTSSGGTITRPHALWVQAGVSRFGDSVLVGATAPETGSTNTVVVANGTAPDNGVADTVILYSSDDAAGHTVPSFFCEGTNVVATGQADSASATRIKVRINGTVYTLLAI